MRTETCEESCWMCGDGVDRETGEWNHCEDVLPTDCTWGHPCCPTCGTDHSDSDIADNCRYIEEVGE